MKRYACTILITLYVVAFAGAQSLITVDSVRLARNDQLVQLVIDVSIGEKAIGPSTVFVVTPRLVGEADSVDFPQIVALGRNAYYHDVRQGTDTQGLSPDAYKIRYKYGPRTEHYVRTMQHQEWMDNSTLKLILSEGTPCFVDSLQTYAYGGFQVPPPDTTIVERRDTRQDELTGSVSGQARIQFIVNRTDFNPNLQNNREELDSMHRSIVSVQQNPDVRITRYRIKGYASPEGPYNNNIRLAKGRTERIRDFMVNQWGVPEEQIEVEFQPEDWEGFRQYMVEHHDEYPDADDIIDIIDKPYPDIDRKLAVIAVQHAKSYRRILAECFPPLRRTDYQIDYDWLRIVDRPGTTRHDTIITYHMATRQKIYQPLEDNIYTVYRPTRPWMALKTNLLLDMVAGPNFEIEFPLGADSRWSIMAEDWFPWYLYHGNKGGRSNIYRRSGHRPYRNSYEIWVLGAELRYWMLPFCTSCRPSLSGTFIGLYAAGGKYDWERHSVGDQGEFTSLGFTLGHSWALARSINMEVSASAGYLAGPRRHYEAEAKFQDNRLIWKYSGKLRYWGPTKLKLSLVWLFNTRMSRRIVKGGEL